MHSPNVFREELKGNVSIVRELHVYGSAVPVHARSTSQFQHKGYGTLLMEEAERIAREEHFSDKIAVISGVGTRHYYRKLGYHLDGVYMSKMLDLRVCAKQEIPYCTNSKQLAMEERVDTAWFQIPASQTRGGFQQRCVRRGSRIQSAEGRTVERSQFG